MLQHTGLFLNVVQVFYIHILYESILIKNTNASLSFLYSASILMLSCPEPNTRSTLGGIGSGGFVKPRSVS